MSFQHFTTIELLNENWKSIPKFEGRYEVSNLGRVMSFVNKKPRILKQELAYGYPYVRLYKTKGSKCLTLKVHRLVLLVFEGESEKCVNHKNGIKTDNRLENLEYATYSENALHAYKSGLTKPSSGESHWNNKFSSDEIEQIKQELAKGLTQKKVAEMFNTNQAYISQIKRGVRRKND